MDVSVIIPTYNEGGNIEGLIEGVKEELSKLALDYEILVVDGGSKDDTIEKSTASGAIVILQSKKGYGNALMEGIAVAKGEYILTMDGDFSHNPAFIEDLWSFRKNADIIIASRYVSGGACEISMFRLYLSILLNSFFAWGLAIPLKDLSSGFRLYRSKAIKGVEFIGRDFDVLQEIIVKAYSNGWTVLERPFHYNTRKTGQSKLKLLKFGESYLKTFHRLWLLRNSVDSVDYDDRACNSRIPLQKYWHRRRKSMIKHFLNPEVMTLDVGCGTSKIIQELENAVGFDISMGKLRYLRGKNANYELVCGDARRLPFKENSFSQVILSCILEHTDKDKVVLNETNRVLGDKGTCIMGSPDNGTITWNLIEPVYDFVKFGSKYTYSGHRIGRYKREQMERLLKDNGFNITDEKYVFLSELITKSNIANKF